MHNEREASIEPGQAALIVTYGNTTRRYRPLEGDLVVLGRSPVCDISLVSPEVALVHCILRRRSDGWRIRDCCGGRHATRLNGRPVREEALHDCDVVQIGTFSFEMRLPATDHHLADLSRLKQEIAGTAPSAPGDRLRADAEGITADHPAQLSAD